MLWVILIVIGYLLGSIPFGYLVSKAKRVDIQKVGSGNIGGTNVSRVLGFKWGAFVAILDVLKGAIPAYLAISPHTIFGVGVFFLNWQIALIALTPVLGHIFPIFLKFKGGKGMATTFGVLIVLLGWKYFLIWLSAWILILIIFKIMSFTNLLMASFLPLIFWISSFSLAYFTLGIILAILIWWAHRENLERIKEGTESKFKLKKSI